MHGWAQDRLDRLFDRGSWEATRRIRAFTARSGSEQSEAAALQTLFSDVLDDPYIAVSYRLADGADVDS